MGLKALKGGVISWIGRDRAGVESSYRRMRRNVLVILWRIHTLLGSIGLFPCQMSSAVVEIILAFDHRLRSQ